MVAFGVQVHTRIHVCRDNAVAHVSTLNKNNLLNIATIVYIRSLISFTFVVSLSFFKNYYYYYSVHHAHSTHFSLCPVCRFIHMASYRKGKLLLWKLSILRRIELMRFICNSNNAQNTIELCTPLPHLPTCVPNNIVIIVTGKNVWFKYKSVYKSRFMSILVWLSKWLQMMHVYHSVDDAFALASISKCVFDCWKLSDCLWMNVRKRFECHRRKTWLTWTLNTFIHTRTKRQPIYNWIEVTAGTPKIVCQ